MGNSCNRSEHDGPPPPLPPKPHEYLNQPKRLDQYTTDSTDDYQFTGSSAQIYDIVNYSEILGEQKTMGELVSEFRTHLPLCFSVSESLYGICGESSLMEGQLLSIHFLKEMKVLVVRAKTTGVEYNLPMCSSLQVSILYDPNKKPLQAKQGYTFDKASDLITTNPLPKVVCALTAFEDMDGEKIEKNNILFIKEVQGEEEDRYLVCLNIQTGKPLKIGKNSDGKFTTAANKIEMSVSKVTQLAKLPVDVVVSSPVDGSMVLPAAALSSVYTIIKQKEEKSVIVSTKYITEDSSNCLIETIEIFLSVPIEVQLVNLPSQETEKLRQEAKSLYDNFHVSKVSKIICDLHSSMNVIQTELYKAIKTDELDEMTLHRPMQPGLRDDDADSVDEEYVEMDNFYQEKKNKPKSSTLPLPRKEMQYGKTGGFSPEIAKSRQQRVFTSQYSSQYPMAASPKARKKNTKPQQSLTRPPIKTTVPPPVATIGDTTDIVPYLVARRDSSQTDQLSHEHQYDYVKFSSQTRDLEVESLKKQIQHLKAVQPSAAQSLPNEYGQSSQQRQSLPSEYGRSNQQRQSVPSEYGSRQKPKEEDEKKRIATTAQENKRILSKFSCQEVIELLGQLGISQYREVFEKENIDGAIFVELDEQVLEKELGITGKLHRLKLLRLLDGRQSVQSLNYS